MVRRFRQMDDAVKLRISQSLRGRTMSETHKQAISNGMKAYWAGIPNKPSDENNESKNNVNNETSM